MPRPATSKTTNSSNVQRGILLFTLVACTALAQTIQPITTATVKGSVQSSSGGPVAQAQVSMNSIVATTDDRGRFTIEGIPAGRDYKLMAQHAGYLRGAYGSRRPAGEGTRLTVSAGQILENLTIVLTPEGVVSGRVVDGTGEPVQRTEVALMRARLGGAPGELDLVKEGTTNDRGDYRLAGLAPGRYFLLVADRRSTSRIDVAPIDPGSGLITYYPNAAHPLSAAPFEVLAGRETPGIDVRLRDPETYAIRGKALNSSTGLPMPNLQVMLYRIEGSARIVILSRRFTNTGPEGNFEFEGLDPGAYAIQITPSSGQYGHAARKDVFLSKGDLADVSLMVHPPGRLVGTMRLDEGDIKSLIPEGAEPPKVYEPGSREFLLAADAHLRAIKAAALGQKVNNRPSVELGNIVPGMGATGMAILNDDGTFLIDRVGASQYEFRVVFLPPGYFVKSATFGGIDALQTPVDFREGGGELNLVLSKKSASVSGALRDSNGKPLNGIPVVLWPRTPQRGIYGFGIHKVVTDQNGEFVLNDVPPGDYRMAGWEDVDPLLLANPAFLDLFTSYSAAVKLGEKDRTRVDVRIITPEDVAQRAQ